MDTDDSIWANMKYILCVQEWPRVEREYIMEKQISSQYMK